MRDLWKAGKLHEAWFREYRELFDELDFSNAKTQHRGGYHFGEWFTAIRFHRDGYKVLTEKYALPSRQDKRAFLSRFLGKQALALIAASTLHRPDLFVYHPKYEFFFFAEAKVKPDRISAVQESSFRRIERELQCQVVVVNLMADRKRS